MSGDLDVSVEAAIDALSEEATVCRDLMHAWMPFKAHAIMGTTRTTVVGYERTLRCRVCGTERREALDPFGAVVSRSYAYPDNYLVKGVGRFNGEYKDAARLSNIKRIMRDAGDDSA